MTFAPFRRLSLAIVALSLSGLAQAQARIDDSDLPASLRRGYVDPVVGPADDRAYARGALGLVRTSYGRASLYVAWRVMQLPPGALAGESHDRKGAWVYGGPYPAEGEDEAPAWLKVRSAVVQQAPAMAPDYFRKGKLKLAGVGEIETQTGQCGPDAFALAMRTLRELQADTPLRDADRRAWVLGQDAVFARCTWDPSRPPAPALPAALPGNAPAKMKALNAYQRAAALFYGDDYPAARQAFDAIAATPGHPMRPWAVLGALRTVVRETVRDAEWEAAVHDAWTRRRLRGAEFSAAVAEPAARRRARVSAALAEIDTRAKAARADAALAPVHGAIDYTVRRALMQLSPMVPMASAMKALDRPEANPYTMGALDLFQEMFPRVSPDRPEGPLAARMREHAWFDFVMAVQACSDLPKAPDPAVCDAEHAHALSRWQRTGHNAWLLATLMTTRQTGPAELLAAEAARAVAPQRPEWASLQFHAARVLRLQGRKAEARAALDALEASNLVHKRDRPLLEAERRAL